MLNHTRCGRGEPLVLVHGLGSQWQVWRPVLERLAADREVVALDLPGFGGSAPLPNEPTVAALARAVADLVAELGLDHPHVAGNSLGGAIALELARAGLA
ncbi:MAG: alpha/beta fold hydrolase, partial [Solirubrobacterales bacterium]|nr:alpha/beta fold hydrolase [Solirubrobacterales bacterium]